MMLVFEAFMSTPRQLAKRQLLEAQRLALKHAADWEEFMAAAEQSSTKVRMYQDRAARISSILEPSNPVESSPAQSPKVEAIVSPFPSLFDSVRNMK